MNIKQYFSVALLGLMAAGFAACDGKDEPVYTPADANGNASRIYFAKATESYIVTDDETQVLVPIYRPEEEGAAELTVQLTVTDESELFTVPESVTFAEGAPIAQIPVTYDASFMTPNKQYPISIAIDDAHADEYGIASITVSLNFEQMTDWALFGADTEANPDRDGYGSFTIGSPYSAMTFSPIRVFERHIPSDPGIMEFVMQIYDGEEEDEDAIEHNDDFEDPEWIELLTFSTEDNCEHITVPDQEFLLDPSIRLADASYLYPNSFENATYFNFISGVFTINMMCYDEEGPWNPADWYINMNGYADTNEYSISLTSNDQVAIDGKDYALIGISLNEHVDEMLYTIVKGELTEEEIEAVVASISVPDSTEYELSSIVNTTGKAYTENIAVVLPSKGKYTMVAVGLHTDNAGVTEVKTSASLIFDYDTFDPYTGWKTISEDALYTDNLFEYIFGAPAMDLTVEVAESEEFEGYYRITNPFISSPYVEQVGELASFGSIEYVVEDGLVYFPESNTGIIYQGDPIYIVSYSAFALQQGADPADLAAKGLFGSYENGNVTLAAQPEDEEGTPTTGVPSFLFALGEDGYYLLNMPFNLEMNVAAPAAAPASRSMAALQMKSLRKANVKAPVWPTPFKAVSMGTPTKSDKLKKSNDTRRRRR